MDIDWWSSLAKVEYDESVGRYLKSVRIIEPKEVLFEEWPLVVAPSGQMDLEEENGSYYCVCSGCCLSLKDTDEDKVFDCPICDWPFCNEACWKQDQYHNLMECHIFNTCNIQQDPDTIRSVYFIRALSLSNLDQTVDQRWAKIRDLTANYTGGMNAEVCSEKDATMHQFLTKVCGLTVDKETVATLYGVRRVNGFQVNCDSSSDKNYYGMALYHLSSIAAHSCHPNVKWRTLMPGERHGYPMKFQAQRQINPGESITIAYRNKCLSFGTAHRREEILAGHGFLCRCTRCDDPSELGTNFSAIRCTHCDIGFFLPKSSAEPMTEWTCTNCKGTETSEFARNIFDRISSQIRRTKNSVDCSVLEVCKKLDTIINRYSRRVLHPNNYLLLWAEFLWLQFMEHEVLVKKVAKLSHEDYVLIQLRAKHCNEIYGVFYSALSKFYGYFERLRGNSLHCYYLNPVTWRNVSDDDKLRIMRKSLQHFERSLDYEGWNSKELEFIVQKLKNVKTIVNSVTRNRVSVSAI